MRLFLDSSVLIAASGSGRGASREIIQRAHAQGWVLVSCPYVIEEVLKNLPRLPAQATADWAHIRPALTIVDDVLTLDRIAVFEPAKDRPILFTAFAWAQTLLTLDRADFGSLLDTSFYGLPIMTPGKFLEQEREGKRIV